MQPITHENEGSPPSNATNNDFIQFWKDFMNGMKLDTKLPHRKFQINLHELLHSVLHLGGYDKVSESKKWARIGKKFDPPTTMTDLSSFMKKFYTKKLKPMEDAWKNGTLNLSAYGIPAKEQLWSPENINAQLKSYSKSKKPRTQEKRKLKGAPSKKGKKAAISTSTTTEDNQLEDFLENDTEDEDYRPLFSSAFAPAPPFSPPLAIKSLISPSSTAAALPSTVAYNTILSSTTIPSPPAHHQTPFAEFEQRRQMILKQQLLLSSQQQQQQEQQKKNISVPKPLSIAAATPGSTNDNQLVGKRIGIYWPEEKLYFFGIVDSFNRCTEQYHVVYDDGDTEWLNLSDEVWVLHDQDNILQYNESLSGQVQDYYHPLSPRSGSAQMLLDAARASAGSPNSPRSKIPGYPATRILPDIPVEPIIEREGKYKVFDTRSGPKGYEIFSNFSGFELEEVSVKCYSKGRVVLSGISPRNEGLQEEMIIILPGKIKVDNAHALFSKGGQLYVRVYTEDGTEEEDEEGTEEGTEEGGEDVETPEKGAPPFVAEAEDAHGKQ